MPMKSLVLLLQVLLVTGCVGSFEESRTAALAEHRAQLSFGAGQARDQHHCDAIDARHETFVYTAGFSGLAAGASGAALGAIANEPGSRVWKWGLGIGAGVTGSLAAGAAALAATAASDWAHDCGSTP
jgi:hypothetical protein